MTHIHTHTVLLTHTVIQGVRTSTFKAITYSYIHTIRTKFIPVFVIWQWPNVCAYVCVYRLDTNNITLAYCCQFKWNGIELCSVSILYVCVHFQIVILAESSSSTSLPSIPFRFIYFRWFVFLLQFDCCQFRMEMYVLSYAMCLVLYF